MNNLYGAVRQLSTYELFALRRSIHADLERRSRLKGPTLLRVPQVGKSESPGARTRNSAEDRDGCIPSHLQRDALAQGTAMHSVHRHETEEARSSAKPTRLALKPDDAMPPSAFP
jgi:hypothetical protein